jgi:hypothetical protein
VRLRWLTPPPHLPTTPTLSPQGGSDYALPNGMRIKHWQKVETEFLYNEIFGPETAYSRDGQLTFAPGQTIVDAGANIGMFTLFAAAATRGHARIVSFEPIPSTFAVLAANCASAAAGAFSAVFKPAPGAALDITPLQLGLSDAPANVRAAGGGGGGDAGDAAGMGAGVARRILRGA